MGDSSGLERECRSFVRMFTGVPPNEYLLEKYAQAHAVTDQFVPSAGFDAWLLRVAGTGPVPARLADAYARRFAPRSTIRRKLVLVLALLEVTPPYHRVVAAVARPAVVTILALAVHGLAGVAAAVLGILLFGPAHLIARLGGVRK